MFLTNALPRGILRNRIFLSFPCWKMDFGWSTGQKTRSHAEFHGAAQNSARPRIFRSIFHVFGKFKIPCPNQPH